MTDPIKMTDTLPPPEPIKMAIDALTCAQQFIRNGVELGYIRMPDADCPDPAHETPGAIRAALAALAAMQQQPVAWIPDAVAEALDRMCTPLHESRLEGVTAKMDAHCMGIIRDYILSTAAAQPAQPEPAKHRFNNVSCSQCGREFGPGNFGFSHCSDHSGESYSKGIEAAAAWLDKRADDYDAEHGSDDPETGTREYPGKGAGLAYYSELRENADSIRELKTALAAASPEQSAEPEGLIVLREVIATLRETGHYSDEEGEATNALDDLANAVCRRRPDQEAARPAQMGVAIGAAMRRAYNLGQTYWQQADSKSYSQNRKSDETAAKFQALVNETIDAVEQAVRGDTHV